MRARSLDRLAAKVAQTCLLLTVSWRVFVATPALAEEATATEPPTTPSALLPAPVPQVAAIVPGLLVHGMGPLLQGRYTTARRMFLLEGASLALVVAGVATLASTGASKYTVAPGALMSATGVTTFGTSLLTGLYATYAPSEGFGRSTGRLPLLETRVGFLRVNDSQFRHSSFAVTSLDAYADGWHLAIRGDFAPSQSNQRWRGSIGRRLWGVVDGRRKEDGSYLELGMAHTEHRYDSDGFLFRTSEMSATGRLDTSRYLPDVKGAFLQAGAGYAHQSIVFDLSEVDSQMDTSLLLMHMGFGIYMGQRTRGSAGGEVELYYDHRHDGLVGGLKVNRSGSGALGHFGARAISRFNQKWGMEVLVEAGSAWMWGANLILTTEKL